MTELIQTNQVQEHAATQTADDDPILVCTFAILVSALDEMASDLYFQRKGGTDSLWMEAEPRYRSELITAPTQGSKKSACKRLFKAHIQKSQRCESITRLIWPGLLSAWSYRSALKEVVHEINENKRQADRHSNAEIVEAARALRLRPEPSGDSPNNWIAKCPGGPHSIMVAPTSNEFGCGYCRIKGGPDILREFANR